ncbi:MAG: site-2 protease family protein [Thermoplasmata archaeon]|nr:site-2 protease family protein [Thermoplasmata archaeon]
MQSKPVPDAAAEVELIKSIVSRYFTIYETNLTYDSVSFKCQVNAQSLEDNFKRLREELGRSNYIPVITYKGGEHTITVGKLPKTNPKGPWINAVMLAFTVGTTIFAGLILWNGYSGNEGLLITPETIAMAALTFAVPLLAILGIHEMGHYYTAKKHGLSASLPFFIPAPPPIGTFGAFISIREPIPDRRTLFNLGISGPIAGFIATIPIALLGLFLTAEGARLAPVETGDMTFVSFPLIYEFFSMFFPMAGDYLIHPTAMAGWVGFLVTAINLIPAGSLDGGHIARSIFGTNSKYISWTAVGFLFVIGSLFNLAWLLFALLVMLLGLEHAPPLNDITKIDVRKKFIGALLAVVLVVSFVPNPLYAVPADYSFEADIEGGNEANISFALSHDFKFNIISTANMNTRLMVDLQPSNVKADVGFSVQFYDNASGEIIPAPSEGIPLNVSANLIAYMTVYQTNQVSEDTEYSAAVLIKSLTRDNEEADIHAIPVNITILAGNYTLSVEPDTSSSINPGSTALFYLNISSAYSSGLNFTITLILPSGWSGWVFEETPTNATNRLDVFLEKYSNLSCTIVIFAPLSAPTGTVFVTADIETKEIPEDRTILFAIHVV